MEISVNPNPIAITKKYGKFAPIEINKIIRNDYTKYQMGQEKMIDIAKKRNIKIGKLRKMFNVLMMERLFDHARITGKTAEIKFT